MVECLQDLTKDMSELPSLINAQVSEVFLAMQEDLQEIFAFLEEFMKELKAENEGLWSLD